MNEELKEIAEDYDISHEEAEEVSEVADNLGLDIDDAVAVWEALQR